MSNILYVYLKSHSLSVLHKWDKKNTCFMILNDNSNCKVSRILMNPRPIYLKRSENDSQAFLLYQNTINLK
jgi:hypothetical protein